MDTECEIELDHLMVPARDKLAAARLLGELLGVPWAARGIGPFAPVYVSARLTIDFDQWQPPIPSIHYCFRVSESRFDAVLARLQAAGIAYRSSAHGPLDYRVGTHQGGRLVYWNAPDAHQWEMLTVSYARQPGADGAD
ncbi:MAG: VOC family protein [Pseudomonadota bacterium]